MIAVSSALQRALVRTLPAVDGTLFLRACLVPGEAGVLAWRSWRERAGDPKATLGEPGRGLRTLVPLLGSALARNGDREDQALLTYTRAAYLAERLRTATWQRVCAEALNDIEAAGFRALLLKGGALAVSVYPDAPLRHCHDVDVLVAAKDRPAIAAVLKSRGFAPQTPAGGSIALVHESGLPLRLHTRLFRFAAYGAPFDELWTRRGAVEVAGAPVSVLAREDALAHVCGHASYEARGGSGAPRWACDAWFLIRAGVDWDLALARIRRMRVELPLSALLDYLARRLDADVPAEFLGSLEEAAASSGPGATLAALRGLGRRAIAKRISASPRGVRTAARG